ncbi:hypothetical protein fugu_000159 [Takifugu bimaculatus]|uniref:Uncharacterized protein n=1 Tax=Takifugu bimaculatus TaxID=433685 RepID=A0A4Z2CG64_9TELE|nr:hypothetical protein fugu_000159 [Takifugu bimaculatus]
MSRVLDSVMMVINESISSGCLCCEEILTPFEWLLDTESIKIEVWRTAFCQNSSSLEQALLMEWQPVVQKFHEIYRALTSQPDYNVTLPMILSEWHKLYNISRFEVWVNRLPAELGEAYWKNWMPHTTHNITGTLLQSFFMSMVNFGEKIEASQWWPELKHYFHMVNWILNYRDAATTPKPTNCQINIFTSSIHCDVNINWTEFVGALTRILRSSNPNFLIDLLKGTVKLLQDIYSSTYTSLASSFLTKELKGGGAMSTYLINLLNKVDDFVKKIVGLPDSSISNIELMRPHISSLLQSTGLTPLLPLLFSHQPPNASAVIDAALKIGRLNQHIFTFNESDATMPELERLIVKFLSMEDNLTISLSHIMGHSLLTYLKYITPDDVARVRKSLEPYTNQTSSGMVEAILKAMELLKTVTDSPNGDPTHIILAYIQQLQEFVISLLRLKRMDRSSLPNGQLSLAQVTELHQIFKDFLSLLTPVSLQNLTRAGPDAAQNTVIQKFVPLLPPHVQVEAVRFLQEFKTLQDKVGQCAAGHNCLAGVSEIFTFLDKILDMMQSANGSVSLTFTTPNTLMRMQQYEEVASIFFPLLLSSNDAAYVRTFRQTLHFIRLVMAAQNITVSDVQNALKQSNLTIDDLNQIATLAGAANINDLIVNIMQIINARQCFEPQNNIMVTAQCVQRLANGVIGFLMHLPALRNDTAILSTIPLIVK